MDFIFLLTGAVCLAEGILLFFGKDFMIFNRTTYKREMYDVKKLMTVEGVLFVIDGGGCILLSILKPGLQIELICLLLLLATLMIHYRNMTGDKFKK